MEASSQSRSEGMVTSRLEAFSDGVLAIIVTIMVLELRPPAEPELDALKPLVPVLLSYILSFTMIAIYWNNHHHLLHATPRISGAVMWANLHLLFWLSLIPFATAWIGEDYDHAWPAATWGAIALLCAVAYGILVRRILAYNRGADISRAIGNDLKGNLSIALYAIGILLAFVSPWLAYVVYVAVAIIWFIPDRRLA